MLPDDPRLRQDISTPSSFTTPITRCLSTRQCSEVHTAGFEVIERDNEFVKFTAVAGGFGSYWRADPSR